MLDGDFRKETIKRLVDLDKRFRHSTKQLKKGVPIFSAIDQQLTLKYTLELLAVQ